MKRSVKMAGALALLVLIVLPVGACTGTTPPPVTTTVTVTHTATVTVPSPTVTVVQTVVAPPPTTTVPPTTTPPPPTPTVTESKVTIDGKELLSEAGPPVVLKNYSQAKNVAWADLRAFLLSDNTDNVQSAPGTFGYVDYAVRLHNNAEAANIRAAFVVVSLGPSGYFPAGRDYYLNAFETTDLGLVYVDVVSFNLTTNQDKTVEIKVAGYYIPKGILGTPVGPPGYENFGKILEIKATLW